MAVSIVACRCASPAVGAPQQCESIVEAPVQLVEIEPAELSGRQLERQRDIVEAATQLDHRRVCRVPLHAGLGGSGALDEQRRPRVVERAERPDVLTDDTERLPAGGENVRRIAVLQHPVDEGGGALEDVLAVVEHEQDGSIGQEIGDALDRLRGGALHAGGLGHRSRHVRLRRHRREIDEHDAVGVVGVEAPGDRHGDGRLADTARSGDRHQAEPRGSARRRWRCRRRGRWARCAVAGARAGCGRGRCAHRPRSGTHGRGPS